VTGKPNVLVVDRLEETHEVLRDALARRGVSVLAASGAEAGLELARTHAPEVIVLDVEQAGKAAAARFEQDRPAQSALLFVGSLRRQAPSPGDAFVSKPYHYGALIQQIERLLAAAA
jgi:CheY-like chemotaxis protein